MSGGFSALARNLDKRLWLEGPPPLIILKTDFTNWWPLWEMG